MGFNQHQSWAQRATAVIEQDRQPQGFDDMLKELLELERKTMEEGCSASHLENRWAFVNKSLETQEYIHSFEINLPHERVLAMHQIGGHAGEERGVFFRAEALRKILEAPIPPQAPAKPVPPKPSRHNGVANRQNRNGGSNDRS